MAKIHPTAIIEDGAAIAEDVEVGAYAYIGAEVEIGSGTVIGHHATVEGYTFMGKNNQVFPYAYIGGKTHDLKFRGGRPGLKIGDGNVFREFSTIHMATAPDTFTVIGSGGNFLAYGHVAHDCIVGDNVIVSAHAALGGHVILEDHAVIGWGSGVHQFCRVGAYAMLSASSKSVKDTPPFMMADGSPAKVCAINKVKMQRLGFSADEINAAASAFKTIYMRGLTRPQALETLASREDAQGRVIGAILEFAHKEAGRGI